MHATDCASPDCNSYPLAANDSSSSACSVEYYLEGLCGVLPGRWDRIERRTELEVVKRDLESYSELIGESGWHAFRIIEATTTRRILKQND